MLFFGQRAGLGSFEWFIVNLVFFIANIGHHVMCDVMEQSDKKTRKVLLIALLAV